MNVFDEMIAIERKIATKYCYPESTFDSSYFNRMEQIFSAGDYYFFTLDVVTFQVEFIHENLINVLGYTEKEFRKDLCLNQIHPEDVPYFLNFGYEVGRFFSQLPADKVMKYKTRYDFRVKKVDGDYIRILHQGLPIQIDEKGAMIRKLIIHTDITEFKKTTPTLSFIGLDDEPSFIDVKVDEIYKPIKNILTSREKQILILLAQGKSRTNIAEKLFVSKFTIDNHRKNMLEKTETKSISELVSKAINDGWI